MSDPTSDTAELSTAPFEHPALDYSLLRAEGIQHLERLIGHVWNDFNPHDPGITILEQLCYAITDLAYRASYDVPDLLASGGGDPYRSLYRASEILTSHPVTVLDLRKLIIDVDGVHNAWIEPVAEPAPALYYRDDKREIGFRADPPYNVPVGRQGRLRALIETSDLVDRGSDVKRDVARRLSAYRPLCTDFELQVLVNQPIQVFAEVEIGPVDDAASVLLAIYERLTEQISPSAPFKTLGEMRAAGKRSDEIFDGPLLDHGFLDADALAGMTRKDAIHASDLIRELMRLPEVKAVRSIALARGTPAREPWSLSLDPAQTPSFDPRGSSIVLVKGQLTARLDTQRVIDTLLERRRRAAAPGRLSPEDRDFALPAGRDRNIALYRSIQHQFPALYGIGTAGLPASVPDRRKAQARQLKAYLLVFDQLLATSFAQLAHAGSLFSFYADDPRTYFTQPVEDDALDLSEIRTQGTGDDLAQLDDPAGSPSSRRNRFLNHLSARFAEQFTDYSLVAGQAHEAGDRGVPDKQAFLQHYPRISSARGTGMDATSAVSETEISGLQDRIERKLGLSAADGERLLVVEHLLLAPIAEDNVPPGKLDYSQTPILSDAVARDPYSLQLSVIASCRGRLIGARGTADELRVLIEHTVREETPAHLTPYLHWPDKTRWPALDSAYHEWRDAYRGHGAARLDLSLVDDPRYFRMRDARDRLIDLLGFGHTYPLRDLPVRDERLTVPFDQPARIPIDASQRGVTYVLRNDQGDKDPGSAPIEAGGTGGTIYLETPPMRDDTTFTILARKLSPTREVFLLHQPVVKVGLDVTLHARILAAPLDPRIEQPADDDARIVAWGTRATVQIDHSQEGVDYHLVQITGTQEKAVSPDVRGNLGNIALTADAATEDVDLQVRATKVFDPSEHRDTQTALLKIVLPLRVRARLDLPAAPEPSALIDFAATPSVRIDSTQASASYALYVRAVSDRDYVFGAPVPGLLAADVDGAPRVYVTRPPQRPIWQDGDGFQPAGEAVQGTGGTLHLALPALRDDSVIAVRARKDHRQGAATIPSSVQLAQAALILVRPDPQPALQLAVGIDGARTTGTVDLTGGQPGVYYELRRDADGPLLGLPGYFHKTDELTPAANKGVGADHAYGLRIEVDLAISRGTQRPAAMRDELATTPPLPPRVATGPLDAGTTLNLRAVKAQTRAMVRLPRTATVAPVPSIAAAPATVAPGTAATIVVKAGTAGERYQLAQDGQPIGAARDGDGTDLAFTTAALSQTTSFQVIVTRPTDPALPVVCTVAVVVTVSA